MESSGGNQEDLMITNSREELTFDEQQENEDGAGKSYDCIFCKRGFTNAQALGGHMNIHRKDRAKNNRPSIINSSKIFDQENYATPIFYQLHPTSSYPLHYYSSAATQFSYQTCFPPPDHTSGIARPSYAHHANDQNPYPQTLNPLGDLENWQMALSLQFDSWQAQDDEKKKPVAIEEDGLDLELRLGQDP